MSVDSASRRQRPYGTREKSADGFASVVKRFVADVGVPHAFRTENGSKNSNSMFVDFCNDLGIRHEFTALFTPQQNGPVKSAISRELKAGHAAQHGVPQLYPDIRLEEIRGCTDAEGTILWLELLLWASECFNSATTLVNDEWLSPHNIFYGSRLAPLGNTVDHPDPSCANRTAERISTSPCRSLCPSPSHLLHRRHSASSRIERDTTATAYTNVELPTR